MRTEALAATSHSGLDTLCHFADSCCPPYVKTLCGRAIDADQQPDYTRAVDCVVCVGLATSRYCPRCGRDVR